MPRSTRRTGVDLKLSLLCMVSVVEQHDNGACVIQMWAWSGKIKPNPETQKIHKTP